MSQNKGSKFFVNLRSFGDIRSVHEMEGGEKDQKREGSRTKEERAVKEEGQGSAKDRG